MRDSRRQVRPSRYVVVQGLRFIPEQIDGGKRRDADEIRIAAPRRIRFVECPRSVPEQRFGLRGLEATDPAGISDPPVTVVRYLFGIPVHAAHPALQHTQRCLLSAFPGCSDAADGTAIVPAEVSPRGTTLPLGALCPNG